MSVSFLHISDLHFLNGYNGRGGLFESVLSRMTPPIVQLRSTLAGLPLKPDFVLLTGDLCEHGAERDYQALKVILGCVFGSTPVFVTPGNHDERATFSRVFLGEESDGSPCFSSAVCAGVRVICIDSSSPEHPDGYIDKTSVARLRAALDEPFSGPTLLATHHHLIDGQFTMPTALYPPEFAELVSSKAISAIFNGHTHHFNADMFCGVPCYTAGSLSFCGSDHKSGAVNFEQKSEATLFTLNDNKLTYMRIFSRELPRNLGSLNLGVPHKKTV